MWDLSSGRNILTLSGQTDQIWSVAFSLDMVIGCVILSTLSILLERGPGSIFRPKPPVAFTTLEVASTTSPQAKRGRVPWYIRSGQWRADIRTLNALLHYLTEPQKVAQTNGMPVNAEMDQPCGCQPSLQLPLALLTFSRAEDT